jgi:hypothetical protein
MDLSWRRCHGTNTDDDRLSYRLSYRYAVAFLRFLFVVAPGGLLTENSVR